MSRCFCLPPQVARLPGGLALVAVSLIQSRSVCPLAAHARHIFSAAGWLEVCRRRISPFMKFGGWDGMGTAPSASTVAGVGAFASAGLAWPAEARCCPLAPGSGAHSQTKFDSNQRAEGERERERERAWRGRLKFRPNESHVKAGGKDS